MVQATHAFDLFLSVCFLFYLDIKFYVALTLLTEQRCTAAEQHVIHVVTSLRANRGWENDFLSEIVNHVLGVLHRLCALHPPPFI